MACLCAWAILMSPRSGMSVLRRSFTNGFISFFPTQWYIQKHVLRTLIFGFESNTILFQEQALIPANKEEEKNSSQLTLALFIFFTLLHSQLFIKSIYRPSQEHGPQITAIFMPYVKPPPYAKQIVVPTSIQQRWALFVFILLKISQQTKHVLQCICICQLRKTIRVLRLWRHLQFAVLYTSDLASINKI